VSAARLTFEIDNSPAMLALDELDLIAEHDDRRRPEFVRALEVLNREEAVYFLTEFGGRYFVMPTARLIALRDALRLRTRLDLPTMEPPQV